MTNLLHDKHSSAPASRWRRQPIYAATRLRCAVAMLILAVAVVLSALPSLATQTGCASSTSLTASADVSASLLARKDCPLIAQRD